MDESRELELMNEDKSGGAAALLLENLRSCEDREFEKMAKRALEDSVAGAADIDAVHPHPLNKTLLDVACSEGRAKVVETLLRLGANVNRVNESHDRTPLHFAAEAGHSHVLDILLEDPRTDPNVRAGGQTALHLAVRKNQPECVRLLLEKGRADPNVVNSRGLTPIHLAASAGQREMVRLMLGASTRLPIDIDSFRDFRKLTTRDVLLNKMPDIELPPPLPLTRKRALPVSSGGNDDDDEGTRFFKSLEDANDDKAIEESLETAARRNFPRAVKQLLAKRSASTTGKTNGNPGFGEAAARVALELGYPEVLREILCAINPEVAERLLLPACQELGVPTWPRRDDPADDPRLECLRLIIEQQRDPEAARREDDKGNTPLHYAARAESLEAVRMLLRSSNCYLGHRNVFGLPPLAHLSSPVLSDFFDECLRGENERTDDFEIEFDYRCLRPSRTHHDGISSTPPPPRAPSEMDTLAYIAEHRGLKSLLKHPLLSSFLYLKWHRVRYFFYANFIFYVFFYLVVNAYVLSTNYCTIGDTEEAEDNATETTTSKATVSSSSSCQRDLRPLRALATVAIVLLAIREILQFVSSPRRYVSSMDNVLEVGLVLVGCWTIVAPNNPQIGAVLVLVSAWQLVLLMGQHPSMSIGIEMFKTVSLNFARFLFLYAFLILAFALAFFTLFKDETNFPDPGRSLFKTIIMLTGEFDASDIPFVSRPILGHCVFLLFVFLIAIVLFNLLNGLAVNDTADIINRSELVALVSRVRLVSYAESVAAGLARCSPRIGPIERALLLFPDYLPRAKIAVGPCKSNRIRIHGRPEKRTANCSRWSMDPNVVERARQILTRRGETTENDKTMIMLEAMRRKLDTIVDEVRLVFASNIPSSPSSLPS